jgi:hypothetical protein
VEVVLDEVLEEVDDEALPDDEQPMAATDTATTVAAARTAGPVRRRRRRVGGRLAMVLRGYRPCAQRGGRMRPSWTTVTASLPSLVNTEPRAKPLPPEADGVSWA